MPYWWSSAQTFYSGVCFWHLWVCWVEVEGKSENNTYCLFLRLHWCGFEVSLVAVRQGGDALTDLCCSRWSNISFLGKFLSYSWVKFYWQVKFLRWRWFYKTVQGILKFKKMKCHFFCCMFTFCGILQTVCSTIVLVEIKQRFGQLNMWLFAVYS